MRCLFEDSTVDVAEGAGTPSSLSDCSDECHQGCLCESHEVWPGEERGGIVVERFLCEDGTQDVRALFLVDCLTRTVFKPVEALFLVGDNIVDKESEVPCTIFRAAA